MMVAVRPMASVIVNRTTHVPAFVKVCAGLAAVELPPSPKSHAQAVGVALDGVESKSTLFVPFAMLGFVGENVKSAEMVVAVTVMVKDVVAVCPEVAVTVSVTVNVPASA